MDSQQAQEDALNENLGKRENMGFDRKPGMPGESTAETQTITQVSAAADWMVVLQLLGIGVLLTVASRSDLWGTVRTAGNPGKPGLKKGGFE